MRKLLICFILYFQSFNLLAQRTMPIEEIDSVFKSIHVSDSDWVIGLSIEQGALPVVDSLGKRLFDDPQGIFLIFKVGKDHFLQKIWYEYLDEPFTRKTNIGNRLKLGKDVDLNYSADSISLAYKEWIHPFVYKDEIDNAYHVQQPADHEPYYGMYFKTVMKDGTSRLFEGTSLTESESFLPYRNLNYLYNSKTFIYRSFVKLLALIKKNWKALNGQ